MMFPCGHAGLIDEGVKYFSQIEDIQVVEKMMVLDNNQANLDKTLTSFHVTI